MPRALVLLLFLLAGAAQGAQVQSFSPRGEAKNVRQAVARFSAPMVGFGDPRLEAPFEVKCAAPGRGRWIDARTWAYDFESDLPGGLECAFTLKAGLRTLAGEPIEGERTHAFHTGGPSVRSSWPDAGDEIDEDQAFLLALDAPADPKTVAAAAYCRAEGVGERIPLRLIEGDERAKILAEQKDRARSFFAVLTKRANVGTIAVKDRRMEDAPLLVARCGRRLPPGAEVGLVWASGIRAPSGGATAADQTLAFRVRSDFVAKVSCTRMNKDAGCVPVLPIEVGLGVPVARSVAAGATLRSTDGKRFPITLEPDVKQVEGFSFAGPFPPRSELTLELPSRFVDDAGRALVNAASFPMKIAIDDDPPLVKFPGRFGILERNAAPALPVTVRNVEAPLAGKALGLRDKTATAGQIARIALADDAALAQWVKRVHVGPRRRAATSRDGQDSIFEPGEPIDTRPVVLPRGEGERTFEVIGVPLPEPGFYVVEFASPRLGAALHGTPAPYYVYSSALVTNLAVHFKRGRESSLVWVTTLDAAKPVAGAAVAVSDCLGAPIWSGKTDANGLARIERELPESRRYKECPHAPNAYFVTARAAGDLAFTLTTWSDGIRPWNFNLGRGGSGGPVAGHTVLDRPLFRAGETVSMKHFLRLRTAAGFAALAPAALPGEVVIRHSGTDQEYRQKLEWKDGAATSRWAIPKDAKLGEYVVQLPAQQTDEENGRSYAGALDTARFRVEQFRVPLMKATLKAPAPLVNARSAQFDAQLAYLAGGAASDAPVKLRSRLVETGQSFAGYDDFRFGGVALKEGVETVKEDANEDAPDEGSGDAAAAKSYPPRTQIATLDKAGGGRFTFDKLPRVTAPHALEVEMEYADPNGQILTAASRARVLPSGVALGIKVDGFFANVKRMPFRVVALAPDGQPVAGTRVTVDAYERKLYSYRKRLLGGFYAYEQTAEVKRIGTACDGRTDARGLLVCDGPAPGMGQLTLVARASDANGNAALATRELYVAGSDEWAFASDSDRIDVLPDKRRYEPGETARVEVRMPFREATALVTIEREGVIASRVVALSAKSPFIDVPIAAEHAPNAFVSVMVLRGRIDPEAPSSGAFAWLARWIQRIGWFLGVAAEPPRELDTRPTATVDLTKPAFKLGIAEVAVGWQAHELKVRVEPEREAYRVRDKARVAVRVTDAQGKPAANAEVALAAVDEGLLALASNASWDLLGAMMARRGLDVETSTGQSQVIGKRHFGRKAVAPGGGGGGGNARELFDTLLLWRDRVALDADGRATVEVPVNDSLTSFRIEAIAHAGLAQFGSGEARIRSTQDVMLFAGLPQTVREGDRFAAMLTVRNATDRPITLDLAATATPRGGADAKAAPLPAREVTLAAGEGRTVSFAAAVPFDASALEWAFEAAERGGAARDAMKFTQVVGAAHPVRVYQATLAQLEGKPLALPVEMPKDAVPGRGGVEVKLLRALGGDVGAIREWMRRYPYACLEQITSKAVVDGTPASWDAVMARLPAFLDGDGLARYFAVDWLKGDDTLTAYLVAIADAAGREIPEATLDKMLGGLTAFVSGRVVRYGALPTADLAMRKLAAIEALARAGRAKPEMLDSIEIAPALWPSSAVLDWISILQRVESIPRRAERLAEAKDLLRSRLTMAGTQLTFSTEKADRLWWLMVSPDLNAVKSILLLADDASFREDMPRLFRGALGRRQGGRWSTTVANAWGVLAAQAFSKRFERDPVSGSTVVALGAGAARKLAWTDRTGVDTTIPWPSGAQTLNVAHQGGGKPWAIVQSRAALPLKEPLYSGYTIKRSVSPVEQKTSGAWTRGDLYRVTLEVEAATDLTWVVVDDPVPSGAAILGTGLGGDSRQSTSGERRGGAAWLAFEERAANAYRAYYEYVPKGRFTLQYTVRLNNAGRFEMPASRVEAMYAPESFGEVPVAPIEVRE